MLRGVQRRAECDGVATDLRAWSRCARRCDSRSSGVGGLYRRADRSRNGSRALTGSWRWFGSLLDFGVFAHDARLKESPGVLEVAHQIVGAIAGTNDAQHAR